MSEIVLDKFIPRSYQLPVFHAFDDDKFRKMILIWPRRAGKDLTVFQIMIREAILEVGVYFYIFPTYAMAKKAIWDSITIEGIGFLEYIPAPLIMSKNSQEMKLKLINGSLIQFVGSDKFDRLRGTNPKGCIFSEYAIQDPRAWETIRPILVANQGWVIFISTPAGRNHFWDMYQVAKESPYWFTSHLTLDDTKHISEDGMKQEREEMSEDMVQQEYYTSFDVGIMGAYYAKILSQMKLDGQISHVPWDQSYKVHTAWDLGINDPTVIIFFQEVGKAIHIIDYYEAAGHAIDHFVRLVLSKPYTYGKHFPPHDIMAREQQTGLTRRERYYQLGIVFSDPCPIDVDDGIDLVKVKLSKMWIDKVKCAYLVKCLENYRQEWDGRRKIYRPKPLHDYSSHAADAMRYLCAALPKTKDGMSAEDVDRAHRESLYGEDTTLPKFFS